MLKSSARYGQVSDFLLSHNGLIREGYVFNLKVENDPVPPGNYIYSAEKDVFRRVETGQEWRTADVINNRNLVQVEIQPTVQEASRRNIEKRLTQESVASFRSGIKESIDVRPLSAVEKANLDSASRNADHRMGKQIGKMLNESNSVVTRKVLSFDMESFVERGSKKITPDAVFSVGIAESIDTTYSPEDKVLNQTRVRKSISKTTSIFDIDRVKELVRGSGSGSRIEGKAIYGRQNLALALEHLNQFVAGKTKADSQDFRQNRSDVLSDTFGKEELRDIQQRIGQMGDGTGRYASIMAIKNRTARNEALEEFIQDRVAVFGNDKKSAKNKALNFLENISRRVEGSNLTRQGAAVEHSHAHGTNFEFSLGRMEYLHDQATGRAATSDKLVFSKDVLLSTVEKLADATKEGGYRQVFSFGDAESQVFSQWGKTLKEELNVLSNTPDGDEVRKGRLQHAVGLLQEVQGKVVDARAMSEQIFDGMLPDIRKHLKNNAQGVRNVVENLFGYDNAQRVEQWGVERFLHQNHSGMSMENLYRVFKSPGYQEWHTGAMDAADLGHFQLYLKDIIDGQKGNYKAPSSKNIRGTGMVGLNSKDMELFNISNKLARNIQSKTILTELFRNQSSDSIVSLMEKARGNLDENTRHLLTDNHMNEFRELAKGDHSTFKSAAMDRLQSVINSEIKQVNSRLSAQKTTFKYTTPEPGLLSKVVSSSPISKALALGAFMYFSSKTAAEDPGASIETGEHNSLETVARRIATTPFNSTTTKYAMSSTSNFISKLMKNRGSFTSTSDMFSGWKSFINESFDDVTEVFTDRAALSPAVVSMKNRIVSKEQSSTLGIAGSVFIPKLTGAGRVITQRAESAGSVPIQQYLTSVNLRNNTTNVKRLMPSDFSNPINTSEFTPRYSTSTGFFVGSSGPSSSSSVLGLMPNERQRVVTLHGDPFSFAHRSPGLAMTDDLHHLYKAPDSSPVISNSMYWVGRKGDQVIDTGTSKIGNYINMSTTADMPTPKEVPGSDSLASYVVAQKKVRQKSMITLTTGNSQELPIDVTQYKGYVQNYRPDNTDPSIAMNAMSKAAYHNKKMEMTGYILPPKRQLPNTALYVNSTSGSLDKAPSLNYTKPEMHSGNVFMPSTQRNPSGGHEFANIMYGQKPGKNAYPSNTWNLEVTGYA